MTKKQTISFFFIIVLLLISEYFLFHELYNSQRLLVLLLSVSGLAFSVLTITKIFKKYKSQPKEQ